MCMREAMLLFIAQSSPYCLHSDWPLGLQFKPKEKDQKGICFIDFFFFDRKHQKFQTEGKVCNIVPPLPPIIKLAEKYHKEAISK